MLNNKIIKIALVAIILSILVYSLSNKENTTDKITKERQDYISSLLNMPQSPLKNASMVDFFPYNLSFVVISNFEAKNEGKPFKFFMTDGSQENMEQAGILKFEIEGKNYELPVFDEGDIYFLPFTDLTNGKQTYGGGRYINLKKSDLTFNKIEIDFNNSHNFYCAYNVNFICPKVPNESNLDIEVLAGEKSPLK